MTYLQPEEKVGICPGLRFNGVCDSSSPAEMKFWLYKKSAGLLLENII